MAERISSNMLYMLGGKTMQDMQAKAAKTQLQMATGKRILSAADDPAAVESILNHQVILDRNTQFQRNADASNTRIQQSETVLSQISNGLQRIRELTLQGKNDSNNVESRSYIAGEIAEIMKGIAQLANARDNNDEYLFSGNKAKTQPFVLQADGSYQYAGDDGERLLRIGSNRDMALGESGRNVFMNIANGNGEFYSASNSSNAGSAYFTSVGKAGAFVKDDYTIRMIQALPTDPVTYEILDGNAAVIQSGTYTSGNAINFAGVSVVLEGDPQNGDEFYVRKSQHQDLFSIVKDISDALNASSNTGAAHGSMHTILQNGLSSLDQAMINMEKYRAQTGAKLNAIEEQKQINDAVILSNQTNMSLLKDLDYIEAISRFQQQMTSYEAAQRSYVQIQSMSLFKFI